MEPVCFSTRFLLFCLQPQCLDGRLDAVKFFSTLCRHGLLSRPINQSSMLKGWPAAIPALVMVKRLHLVIALPQLVNSVALGCYSICWALLTPAGQSGEILILILSLREHYRPSSCACSLRLTHKLWLYPSGRQIKENAAFQGHEFVLVNAHESLLLTWIVVFVQILISNW